MPCQLPHTYSTVFVCQPSGDCQATPSPLRADPSVAELERSGAAIKRK